jgi:hypothetical protein
MLNLVPTQPEELTKAHGSVASPSRHCTVFIEKVYSPQFDEQLHFARLLHWMAAIFCVYEGFICVVWYAAYMCVVICEHGNELNLLYIKNT